MSKDELLARISVDPGVGFGKPCIRGHRIWVSLVLDLLAAGWSHREILENYPGFDDADVLACIAYGAEMTHTSPGQRPGVASFHQPGPERA